MMMMMMMMFFVHTVTDPRFKLSAFDSGVVRRATDAVVALLEHEHESTSEMTDFVTANTGPPIQTAAFTASLVSTSDNTGTSTLLLALLLLLLL